MAPDKEYPENYFSYFLHKKHILLYSLEEPWQGTSNEFHNIYFCGEIRKICIFLGWKTESYLELRAIFKYMYIIPAYDSECNSVSKLMVLHDIQILSNTCMCL